MVNVNWPGLLTLVTANFSGQTAKEIKWSGLTMRMNFFLFGGENGSYHLLRATKFLKIKGENKYLNKLVTLVKGDPKAPFSIATTLRCKGGHYSIPWIVPFYPWSLPYNAVLIKAASSTIFDLTRDWTPISQTIGKHSTR